MNKHKVTLNDIAEQAGVSKASVSMILSGREASFAPKTVALVKQIAIASNYSTAKSTAAANMTAMRKIILLVSPNMYNPYYTQTIQSIENSAWNSGYKTLSFNTYRSPDRETELMSMAVNCEMAGIIFTYLPMVTSELSTFIDKKIPIIVMGDPEWAADIDMVNINYYHAGILMATHLIELGHRHVAFLSTTMQEGNLQKRKRLQGVLDTFDKLKEETSVTVKSMDVQPETELTQNRIEIDVGKKLVDQCIDNEKITAFIGVNDMVAYGIIDRLLELGKRIPEDYSVCGYDNIFPSSFKEISLTTIDLGIEKKGQLAFSMLCNKIEQRKGSKTSNDTIARIEYKVRLIVRNSSGKPRQ